jgi:DNA-binding response OmpR family regulator
MHPSKRVFLIDDDEDDRLFFGIGLNEFDPSIEILYDRDSEMALRRLSEKMQPLPDIVFLDWNMPKLSGRQILGAIRANRRFNKVPVIIFTTSSSEQDKDEAKELGASYFLSKPASLYELKKNLEEIFSSLLAHQHHFSRV